jgi:hypothetical protein
MRLRGLFLIEVGGFQGKSLDYTDPETGEVAKGKIVGQIKSPKAKSLNVKKFIYKSHSRSRKPYHGSTHPTVIVLGTFQSKGRTLVAGINWDYLDSREQKTLQKHLRKIMDPSLPLIQRYRIFAKGKHPEVPPADRMVLSNIFRKYYRTYRDNAIHGVSAGRISIE